MPIVCLISVDALDVSTGNRVTVYAASANDRRVTGLNGQVWEPAITQTPNLTVNLWNGDFEAAPDPANAVFAINMEVIKRTFTSADQYAWIGAPVKIWAEEIGTAWPWTQRFQGRVSSINRKGQNLSITAKVETETFAKNVLTAAYAGTGGAEGGADIKGRAKPLVIGWAQNVEPVLIDAVNSVYQFSGYGPIEGVPVLYERASDFGASVGDYADYATLVAAAVPAGRWATCLAQGLVRLGAPAYGVITGDVRGHRIGGTTPRLTGAMINALATISGVSTGNLNTASLTALDSAVPYNVNLVVTDQTKFIDLAVKMALACNYQAAISLMGQFFVSSINLAATPALTLNAQGRASPQVINPPDELEVSIPYWKVILGANRSWRQHTLEEIALISTWVERGLYSGSTTYRDGNVVSTSDGSRYRYINATASAGNAPPNATFWELLSGSPTVAGVVGQTAWATFTGYTPAQVTNPGANLLFNSSFNIGFLGWVPNGWAGPYKASGDVGAYTTSANIDNTYLYNADVTKTPVFPNNQYTFQNYTACNGSVSGGGRPFFYIDWHNSAGAYISSSAIGYVDANVGYKVWSITATSPATAAYARVVMVSGLVGTGGGSVYTSKWKLELGGAPTPWSDDATNGALYQSGQTIDSLKPAQVNADVTGTNTAAGILSQGDLATQNKATLPFGGGNAVFYSLFEKGQAGWGVNYNPLGLSVSWTTGYYLGVTYGKFIFTNTAAGQSMNVGMDALGGGGRYRVPVSPGQAYYGQVGVEVLGPAAGAVSVLVVWMDAGGGVLSGSYLPFTGTTLSFTNLYAGVVTAPTSARSAYIEVQTTSSGAGTSGIALVQPMLTGAVAGQTARPPFTPGPNSDNAADVTSANTAAGIAGQGDLATANRASLPFGDNAFANSDLTTSAAGWEFIEGNNGGYGGGGGRNAVGGYFGRRNVGHTVISSGSAIPNTIYLFGPGMKGFWAGGATNVKRYGLPVKAGDRIYLGGKFSVHGGTLIVIRARFYNESGTLLNEQDAGATIGNGRTGGPSAANGDPANLSEQGAYFTVPSGAFFALMGCYTYSSGTDPSVYIFVAEPIIARVPASQTAILTYAPGPPDRAVDVTGENVAAAIVGQGTGATASTLAGLDAAAAAQLSALTAGSTYVAAVGSSFQMFLTPGQSVALSGRYATFAGGSSSGSLTCLLRVRPAGGSYSTFATGPTVSIGPSEPNASAVSGTFTNSTGVAQVFEFTVDASITPGTAGGGADPAKSYIKV